MNGKKPSQGAKDQKKDTRIKDLEPSVDPKGGGLNTPVRPDTLPRGGWDGNHNVSAA